MRRPEPSEYHDFYRGYVKLVPDRDLFEVLEEGLGRTVDLLGRIPEEAETFRYEPGKWSVREVVGHVTDSERLFAFRALHIGRGDPVPLPGMDQEVWAEGSNAHERPLAEHADELRAVRDATLRLFRGMNPEMHDRRGIASGHAVTVRALAGIIAGHEAHHRRVLEERYLPGIDGGGAGSGRGAS